MFAFSSYSAITNRRRKSLRKSSKAKINTLFAFVHCVMFDYERFQFKHHQHGWLIPYLILTSFLFSPLSEFSLLNFRSSLGKTSAKTRWKFQWWIFLWRMPSTGFVEQSHDEFLTCARSLVLSSSNSLFRTSFLSFIFLLLLFSKIAQRFTVLVLVWA